MYRHNASLLTNNSKVNFSKDDSHLKPRAAFTPRLYYQIYYPANRVTYLQSLTRKYLSVPCITIVLATVPSNNLNLTSLKSDSLPISTQQSSVMAPLDDTTPETRFDSFNIYRTSYKVINNHPIDVGILVPKTLDHGKHPILVKFHGGGLVRYAFKFPSITGARLTYSGHRRLSLRTLVRSILRPVYPPDQFNRSVSQLPARTRAQRHRNPVRPGRFLDLVSTRRTDILPLQ